MAGHFATSLPTYSENKDQFIQLHLYLLLEGFDDSVPANKDYDFVCQLGKKEICYEKKNHFYYATTKILADTKKLKYKVAMRFSALDAEELYCGERVGVRKQKIEKGYDQVATFDVMNRRPQVQPQWHRNIVWENILKTEIPKFLLDEEDFFPWKQKLRSWIYQIGTGWTLKVPHAPNDIDVKMHKENISQVYRDALNKVKGFTPSENISKMITFVVMTSPDLKIEYREYDIICKALAMHNLTENEQRALHVQTKKDAKEFRYGKNLKNVISSLFEKIYESNQPDWILALPLYWLINNEEYKHIHFTFQDSNCDVELPQTMGKDWASVLKNMKSDYSQRRLRDIFEQVVKLSKLHPWIARPYFNMMECTGMMTLLSEHQDLRFDPKIIVSILSSHLKDGKLELTDMQAVDRYFSKFVNDVCVKENRNKEPHLIIFIVENIVGAALKKDLNWKVLIWTMNILSKCVNADSGCKVLQDETEGQVTRFAQAAETFIKRINIDMTNCWKNFFGNNIDNLTQIFNCKWQSKPIQDNWLAKISKCLEDKIKEFGSMASNFLEAYSSLPDILNKDLEMIFDEAAYNFFRSLFKCNDLFGYGWLNSQWELKNLSKFSEKFFQEESKSESLRYKDETNDQEKQLEFVLNWKHSAIFYHHIYGKLELQEDSHIKKCTNVLKKSVLEDLQTKQIPLGMLIILSSKPDVVKKLVLELKSDSQELNEQGLGNLERLRKDVINFRNMVNRAQELKTLCMICKQVGIELQNHETMTAIPESYKTVTLREMEKFIHLSDDVDWEDTKWFLISYIKPRMENVVFFHRSTEIPQIFRGKLTNLSTKETLSLLSRFIGTLHEYAEQIAQGDISIKILQTWAESLREPGKTLENEVANFYKDTMYNKAGQDSNAQEEIIKDIRKKIQWYVKVMDCEPFIDMLISLKDKFDLKGNEFDTCLKIKEFLKDEMSQLKFLITISSFIPTLDNLLNKFKSSSVDMPKIAASFLKENEFFEWLQNKLIDIAELGVLAELALTFGIDGGVKTVSSFVSAVNGFEPLLFNMHELTFEQLLRKCERLMENATADEDLVENWHISAVNLEFFQEIEFSHGSIEKSSLQAVRSINEKGIFNIRLKPGQPATLENVVQVYIPSNGTSTDQPSGRRDALDFIYLRNLQSTLTLMGELVDTGMPARYSHIFGIVEKLANVLIRLVEDGFTLFNGCCIRILPGEGEHIRMKIFFKEEEGESVQQRFSLTDAEVVERELDKTHMKWKQHVKDLRMKYYYLNEYSINQIVYLCNQLSDESLTAETHQDQVNALLSIICPEITFNDIRKLLETTKEHLLETKQKIDQKEPEECDDANDDEMQKMKDGVEKVIGAMKRKRRQTERLAKAAVMEKGWSDIKQCKTWIMMNESNQTIIKELSTQFDRKIVDLKNSKMMATTEASVNSGITSTQETILKYLNEKCMFFTADFAVSDRKDFISMAHLGEFLTQLSHRNKIEKLKRILPWPLQPGQPNLLTCSDQDMLLRVISLYMEDLDQPLPTASEVLICTEKTTEDNVERFFCRAMSESENNGSPLFCIAYLNRLTDSVMKAAENIYEDLKKFGYKNYQLVVLSNDSTNYLANSFEEFQVADNFVKGPKEVSCYVQKHLIVGNKFNKSIAGVDKFRSSVRFVVSSTVGAGKSLHISRKKDEAKKNFKENPRIATLRFLEKEMKPDMAIRKLLPKQFRGSYKDQIFVHIDITNAVEKGIEEFLFNLFVLGRIVDKSGKVWIKHPNQYYMIEITDQDLVSLKYSKISMLNIFPNIVALQPQEVISGKFNEYYHNTIAMDSEMFKSQLFQRPYHNLKCYREYITTPKKKEKSLNEFTYSENKEKGTQEECIKILLEYCGDKASWSQIEHFVTFLDSQLKMCEIWYKENKKLINDAKSIVMKYIIEMGKRFIGVVDDNENNSAPKDKSMIFFHEVNLDNKREVHMTFFEVKKVPPNLLKLFKESDKIGGKLHRVEEFDDLEREKQLRTLRLITNALTSNEDPDPTYKLTTDNLQKIISLNMRIQCKIPVILEGETGCGKTRMVEFLSKLKASDKNARVLITRKVYGGVTASDIQKSVKEAEKVWSQSKTDQDTRLIFFDEANTTEAIYAIKEVMCDNTFDGEAVAMKNTTIIAACNPHKEMSETAIEHLMSCGLGSKIHANQADEKSGSGMRNLVYKVLPLPPSMKPYVWVTKQADETTENLYIEQIAKNITSIVKTEDLSKLVSEAHQFIKEHNDGFRFVSLRDVERCMKVYEWFHNNSDVLFPLIDEEKHNVYQDGTFPSIEPDFRKLIHAINVCYHASLQHNRSEFREKICHTLKNLRVSNLTEYDLLQEFLACQRVFLLQAQIQSSENISYNRALMENFFMMVVCVDLRIPLFVIGKPGSSKSLAKTLVSNCMRGRFSESKLFSKLKQANLMSYQCSALSDAAGIIHTFEQCCDMQENNDSNTFTSVAVLDEIGLAEDSPAMPLKVLHPLLEFGSIKNNERGHQVAFLGLSNWPLDPAKLNRGVFLFHENPDNEDLYKTATEICAINEQSHPNAQKILKTLTKVYLEIETNQDVKYFGLRDFYSLIKSCNGHFGDPKSLFEAVGRNFGGMESDVLEKFKSEICKIFPHSELVLMPIKEVVQTNLGETDSRYLLLLTNYYPSINLVSLVVKNFDKMKVIVGSAFPGDQTFAKICRNIQEVKTCMETGTPVVMLNLAEIQESLYDALNQHYNTLGGKRYVDIGLGGQRLKCCVAENFRLIILEKKDKAYTEYPIPLLNRLEKHLLDSDGLLPESEKDKMVEVQKWTELFVTVDFQKSDSLVGHQKDTVSSTLLLRPDQEECKVILLQSATLDAMYRIKKNIIDLDKMKKLHSTYFEKQSHYKLTGFLNQTLELLGIQKKLPISIFEIVSYSGILVGNDREQLEKNLNLKKYDVMILNIRQFYTLREFEHDVDIFLQECRDYKQDTSKKINAKILVLQCPQAHKYAKLIECAKHSWSNKDKTGISITIIVIVLWSIERNTEFLMQQAQDNRIIYIDEVRSFQTDETKADPTASENFFSTETLLNTNLTNIFAPKNASNKFMKKFLQDSLSKAMTKIEGSQIASTRYKARVKTLTNLLQTDEKIGKSFRNKFLDKIHKILMSKDILKCNKWIHLVANDKESLQEGGTFHKALLLYLKTLISNLIAHFICNIDVQCNLNLIEKFPDVYHQDRDRTENIWLSMFEKLSFDHLRPDWMHKEFIAVSPITERPTMACKFPFGCVVTGSLQTHLISEWESSSKDCNASLVKFFRQHNLYPVIKYGISTYPELLQGYVHDLVNSHYTPSSEQHLETEVNAVIKLVEKRAFDGKDNVEQADKFPLVYSTFIDLKDKLRILREVFKVSPLVAESINTVMPEKIWNWHDGDIHHWGMLKALEDLRQKTTFFSENPESCLSWLEQAKSIEKTVYLVHDCIQEQKKKDELMLKWLPISLVNVLLLQLIPNDEYRIEYTEVIANSAELLVSVQDEQNIEDFTIIVCNTLGRCYDDIRIKILLSWEEMTCKMCKEDMEDPQCLTCGHFFCLQCCEEILIDDSPKCTQCLTIISKEEPYKADILSKSHKKRLQQFQFSCTSFFIEFLKTICFSSVMKPVNEEKMKSFIKLIFTLLFQTDNDRKLESSAIGSDINTKACLFGELVKNEQELVTEEINKTLQQESANEKREISQFIIYHFEQRLLFEKSNSVDMQDLEKEHLILHSHQLTLETLKSIATLRNACRKLAIQLYEKSKQCATTEMDDIINSFIDFCKRSKVIDVKQLVIKAGCAQFGIDWYREMLKSEVAKGLIPEKWKTAIDEYDTDHWLLFDAILTEVEGGLRKPLQSRDDFMSELAAKPPSREKLYFAVKRKYKQGLNRNSHITNDNELGFFIKINNQVRQVFRNIDSAENLKECGSVQLLVMFVATAINKGCHMMSGFAQFALKPSQTSRLSLPTMFSENEGSYREDTTLIVLFILHASILIGFTNNSEAVKIMLKGSIRTPELDKYLTEELCTILRNLKDLWKMDMHDTFLIMHHVLEQIWDTECLPNTEIFDWVTQEGRCQWKTNFQEKYLSFTVSVDSVNETLKNIKTEKNRRLVQSNLFKFLHDGDMTDDDLDENLLWKRESLCCYTELCCLERLQQVLDESKKTMGCILKTVLTTENINLIQGLETVLNLHRILIERCQGFSYENFEKRKLEEYLKNDDEKQIAERYMNLWNKVMPTLRSKAADSALLTDHIYELSKTSPVTMFIPSNIGQGQCAKMFAEYLIDVQNTLIDECKVSENVTCKFDEIDVSDVTSAHLICIEKHRDILPLIQTHAVYTIEKDEFGKHHNVIYKLDVLEKQVEVKFLKNKRLIRKKTLPRIWYSSNTGMESDWNDIISNNEQNELPVNLKMQTDGLASYSSTLYSAVRSLEDGIRRLATVQMDPKTRIKKFLDEECKISSAELEGIPSTANIEHTLALYSRLSWHRSKLYFSRRLDPYSEILPEGSQEEIKKPRIEATQDKSKKVESTHEKLNAVLQNADINVCQQHINEVIIRLPGTSPEKRLAKDVFPRVKPSFLTQVKTRQWYSELPDDIRFKHISYLFKQTMKLQSK